MTSHFHNRHRESQLQEHRQRASAPMQRRPQNRETQSALDSLHSSNPTICYPSKFVVGHRTDITSHSWVTCHSERSEESQICYVLVIAHESRTRCFASLNMTPPWMKRA